jgi:hypothetical protein
VLGLEEKKGCLLPLSSSNSKSFKATKIKTTLLLFFVFCYFFVCAGFGDKKKELI